MTSPKLEPLEITIRTTLCDAAAAIENKLYIHGGGWNRLTASQFPFQYPRIAIAYLISIPWTQTNKPHTMVTALIDEDGEPFPLPVPEGGEAAVVRLEAHITIGRPPNLTVGEAQVTALAANLDGLQFTKPGAYSFVTTIDGTEVDRVAFRVDGIVTM